MEWIIFASFSALFSAAAAISEKRVLFNLSALQFSFLVSLFNLLFSVPFLISVDFSKIESIGFLILFLKSFLGALSFLFVMLSIKNFEISKALPLLVLTPGFTAIAAFLFLGESLSSLEILGMVLLLIGTYTIEKNTSSDLLAPLKIFIKSGKHHYIIIAILLFTVTSVLDKLLLLDFKFSPTSMMSVQHLFSAFIFLLIVLLKREKPANIFQSAFKENLIKWLILISIFTIGYRLFQFEAVKLAPVALVLSVKRTSVFFATIIGGRIFREGDLMRKSIATIILLVGAILIFNG
ncbi:MAG: EamA family transporter [Melioribacteraceae bacterium]|nr:EamA family transporter [Melioribacteraceae bacterium]MCF8264715.1 EamA family transporter [Melioribacteraceae bacterium]MCF8431373.1 EamA family transporter [Melioribacteraceae bacterium]